MVIGPCSLRPQCDETKREETACGARCLSVALCLPDTSGLGAGTGEPEGTVLGLEGLVSVESALPEQPAGRLGGARFPRATSFPALMQLCRGSPGSRPVLSEPAELQDSGPAHAAPHGALAAGLDEVVGSPAVPRPCSPGRPCPGFQAAETPWSPPHGPRCPHPRPSVEGRALMAASWMTLLGRGHSRPADRFRPLLGAQTSSSKCTATAVRLRAVIPGPPQPCPGVLFMFLGCWVRSRPLLGTAPPAFLFLGSPC